MRTRGARSGRPQLGDDAGGDAGIDLDFTAYDPDPFAAIDGSYGNSDAGDPGILYEGAIPGFTPSTTSGGAVTAPGTAPGIEYLPDLTVHDTQETGGAALLFGGLALFALAVLTSGNRGTRSWR